MGNKRNPVKAAAAVQKVAPAQQEAGEDGATAEVAEGEQPARPSAVQAEAVQDEEQPPVEDAAVMPSFMLMAVQGNRVVVYIYKDKNGEIDIDQWEHQKMG